MPCYCEPDKREINDAEKKIKEHAQKIVDIIRFLAHPTDRYPQELKDAMKLLEHLYTGECDERNKC